jgi:hypothetical protein
MTGRAVVGPLTGHRLEWIPSEVTTWKRWRAKHPETTVLKPPLQISAYAGTNKAYDRYRRTDEIWFPVGPNPIRAGYPNKTHVTIVLPDGRARCYPHPALKEGVNADGDLKIIKQGISVRIEDKDGKEVTSMLGYWFAWCAFYPKGTVYEGK